MNKVRLFLLSLLVFFALIIGIVTIHLNTNVSYAHQAKAASNSQAGFRSSTALGLPAITPHGTVSSNSAAFTTNDVVQYVGTHLLPDATISGSKPVIKKVEFLTNQEVSMLLGGESVGTSDNTLLCYVELQGTFTFYGPRGAQVTYHIGIEVFDAHTGNLLITGGR